MTSSEADRGASSGRAAGWVGSLEGAPFAEVLRRIAIEERSGDLQVSSASATKTIYFDQGFIVFASSNLKGDRLGEFMIEAGRISRREFATATDLMEGGKRKFGQALVWAGIVSEEELGRHVAAQVNRIVLSLFSLKQGTYSFDERPCSIPLELMVSLSVYRVLIDGIRRMRSKRLVIMGLPPFDTKLKVVEAPPFTLDFYRLRPEERAVLRSVREGKTLRDIAGAHRNNEGVVLRACYGLIAAGVIEAAAPEGQSRPRRVQEETGTFVLSGIRRRMTKEPEEAEVAPISVEPDLDDGAAVQGEQPEARPPLGVSSEEPPGAVSSTEDLQESTATGWNLSQLALDAAKLVKVTLLDPIFGFVRRLFGSEQKSSESIESVSPTSHEVSQLTKAHVPKKVPVVPTPRPEEQGPRQPARAEPKAAKEDDLVMEIIGIPPWSVKDDPADPVYPSTDFFRDHKEEPVDDRLGVPKWSVADGPDDRSGPSMEGFLVEGPAPEPVVEELRSPSWSLLDRSSDLEEERPVSHEIEEAVARSRESLPEIELESEPPASVEPAYQSLESLDSDLFVEADAGSDSQPSMLSHIPVEEIKLEEESPELEIEIEIEDETFVGPPEPAPEPPSPTVGESESQPPEWREPPDEMAVSTPKKESRSEGDAPPSPDGDIEAAAFPAKGGVGAHRVRLRGGEERLLRDVKLHFQCKDWEGAVRLLEELVQNSPGSAFYRGLLARAMSRHPVMRDKAEKHFIEALRLSPQDAQLHYWLGLYYKSFGLKSRAVNEFRTALRIDPKHQGARKQFSRDGGKQGVLKRFFR